MILVKRVFLIFLSFVMVLSFAGCSVDSAPDSERSEEADSAENKFANAAVGDIIKFGTYEQDCDSKNGKEEIEWLVLDKVEGRILVISKHSLDAKPYNDVKKEVTWETCTLRKWLNETFYNESFSDKEKNLIPTVMVVAEDNPVRGTDAGNDTQDKVYLLSISEAEKYFDSEEARKCITTSYSKMHGANVDSDYGTSKWWLRTPGYELDGASRVLSGGSVKERGTSVADNSYTVRPAMWIETE